MTIEVLISQSFKNQQIIIENKFYLFDYKHCKRQLHKFSTNKNALQDLQLGRV